MAKMKSSLLNMLLSLTIITLVAAGLLAGAYTLTKDTIAETNAKNVAAAKLAVLPEMEGLVVAEEGEEVDGMVIYKATVGDEEVGAAVKITGNKFTNSKDGKTNMTFGGEMSLMVGFDKEGTITGFKVLAHQETPGLGAKMADWFSNPDKADAYITGKNPGEINFFVKQDGGDVDAITAATITSRAFLSAVVTAYDAYLQQNVEAQSGATQLEAPADTLAANDSIVEPVITEEN